MSRIGYADPLAICEWCKRPTADALADCEREECRARASAQGAVLAGLAEPTFEEIAAEKRSADL